MSTRDDKGNWIDAAGDHIPVKYVDPVDKRRDRMIEKVFKQALKVQESIRGLKELTKEEVTRYLDWLAEKNGEESLNPGGNYELRTFFGDKQIKIKVNKMTEFDERLQVAKQKIDKCLERWADGGNANLKTVVMFAFKVDKKGNVDTQRILGLRKLKIKDTEWNAAMELITDAITFTGTRKYLQFQIKKNPDAEWETVRLDLAGV
jgi:Protein of unknown function (DUF3164)